MKSAMPTLISNARHGVMARRVRLSFHGPSQASMIRAIPASVHTAILRPADHGGLAVNEMSTIKPMRCL